MIFWKGWLPGPGFKRWLAAIAAGSLVTLIGVLLLFDRLWITGILLVLGGISLHGFGNWRLITRLSQRWLDEGQPAGPESVYHRWSLGRGPRIVVIGGGTGLSNLLRGLKRYTSQLTAIVTVADDGGSSGRLRADMAMPAPGDIRNCLVALANTEPGMEAVLQYRFQKGALAGHSLGNLFLGALTELNGDFEAAVEEANEVLAVRGQVLPATAANVSLIGQTNNGSLIDGESQIGQPGTRIRRVWLDPKDPPALPKAVKAIENAEAVIIGPGSLFTSVLPNLVIPGIRDAVRRSPAAVIYVCNVMTQPGETEGYSVSDHVRVLEDHIGQGLFQQVLVNVEKPPATMLERYQAEGAQPVAVDSPAVEAMGYSVIEAPVISHERWLRHDPNKVAVKLLQLFLRSGRFRDRKFGYFDRYLLRERLQ